VIPATKRYHFARILVAAGLFATIACAHAAYERVYSLTYGGETAWVCRDAYGTPHIYSPSESALFYANGYTTAEDRLYQLELYRRDGAGTLAALLGSEYVSHDEQVRRDGYTEAERQAQFDALPARFRTILQSYRDGINAYIAEAIADPDHKLPKEFWDLATAPQPWTVTDSLAVIQMMVRRFGAAGGGELTNQAYLDANGWDAFNAWFPLNDPTAPCTIPDAEAPPPPSMAAATRPQAGLPRNSYPGISPQVLERMNEEEQELMRELQQLRLPTKLGSFADVVAPSKSATGNPMLLGCPQMGYSEPQISDEADLHCPTLDVAGMQFAGCPSILIGRNRDLAWTTTSGMSDCIDTVIETLNPANQTQYWYQGSWHDAEHRVERIDVAGGAPIDYDCYRTVHGPVTSYDLGTNRAFVMHATFWNDETSTISAFLDFNLAHNLTEFQGGVSKIVTSHNFLCADRSGNIGYWHAGRYPLRAPGVDPRLPMGGEGDQEWTGFRAFADLPQLLNPVQAYFSNWNNKPVYWWDHGDKRAWIGWNHVQLIMDLMNPNPSVTFDDMKAIPYNISSQGTYEQVVEVGADVTLPAVNIVPPGQSGFINRNGVYDPHFFDQKTLYNTWDYKPFEFLVPGGLGGHVLADGAAIADVIIEARLASTLIASTVTAPDGSYTLASLPPGDYDVTIAKPGYCALARTITIPVGQTVPREFELSSQVFDDVPCDVWTRPYIEAIYREGITSGCGDNPLRYCPTSAVTRAQMAVFVCRAAVKTWHDPGAATFTDVPRGVNGQWDGGGGGGLDADGTHWAYGYIERLADPASWSGTPPTGGCAPAKYCPEVVTTRGQMAAFLCRATGRTWLDPGAPSFSDVPATHPFYGWIERLADPGSWIVPPTTGCAAAPLRYCPTSSVTRGQMAVFLCRAFNIPY
jgi:acyl-homoserine lactone acylase PvdQ